MYRTGEHKPVIIRAAAMLLGGLLLTGSTIVAVPMECTVEYEDGSASHVGPWSASDGWEYPWAGVLEARKAGRALRGSITETTEITDITKVVALHRVMYAGQGYWLGRSVIIEHTETGIQETALVLDALAGNYAHDEALGYEEDVDYSGVVADLTPQMFARLDNSQTGWPERGRIPVRVWYVDCPVG